MATSDALRTKRSILPRQWADQGYIVVVPTHLESIEHPDQRGVLNDRFPPESAQSSIQRAEEMKFLLDEFGALLAALNAARSGGYSGDLAAPVVTGHSHGAFTAAALTGAASARPDFAGLADPSFEAAVLVSPQGAVGPGSWHGFYGNFSPPTTPG